MALNFNHHAAVGNQVIHELSAALGIPDEKEKAGRILQAVLHALRNQLTLEESIQLLAQLPMMLKAVYVTNWNIHKKKRHVQSVEDFLSDVLAEAGKTAFNDFTDGSISWIAGVTLQVLGKYFSSGEAADIVAVIPKAIKDFVGHHLMQEKTGSGVQ